MRYQIKPNYSFIEHYPNSTRVRRVVPANEIIELTDAKFASCGQIHKLIKLESADEGVEVLNEKDTEKDSQNSTENKEENSSSVANAEAPLTAKADEESKEEKANKAKALLRGK